MAIVRRPYGHARDFLPIRDLLVETYGAFPQPLNWRLERWNYCHCFVAPYIADYGRAGVDEAESARIVAEWRRGIALWHDEGGALLGVVQTEDQRPGPAFIQRRPAAESLLPEMLDYIEGPLAERQRAPAQVFAYSHDPALPALLHARGYRPDAAHPEHDASRPLADLPAPRLPAGYVIRSMAEENDLPRRAKAFGLGFNHPDPKEWPSVAVYAALQRAPDYRPELDLYITAPDGEFVSFCIVWHDARNRLAVLEPVGTHPDYRRRGLGRAVVCEGLRRAAALGAERSWVGSGQAFYQALGFRLALVGHIWSKPL